MPQITIAQLFEDNRERLALSWEAGMLGGSKVLDSELIGQSTKGLIGHLNFIHPNWIQVLSHSETDYLNNLDAAHLQEALHNLSSGGMVCMIVAGGESPPPVLKNLADATATPLFGTSLSSLHLMWMLRPYLARVLANSTTMHGVFLDVLGMGVLISGDSGVGKSELGLELISRGNGLVADDIVELYRVGPETVEGRCPPVLRDFLEVRGLGVLNIRTIFGETAVRPRKNLKLIVHLEKPVGPDLTRFERLPLNASSQEVLGVEIRKVIVPVAAGRNLAVLTEAAVRNYVLQLRGIDSTQEFLRRHESLMASNAIPDPGEL
ncbi:MAG TPA: HPr(Ser) kinase/phosphatase [Burkholderiales bacterium]|nr:HPr(Ser) kinase/phosphatase [Burkholderiales bacterium]